MEKGQGQHSIQVNVHAQIFPQRYEYSIAHGTLLFNKVIFVFIIAFIIYSLCYFIVLKKNVCISERDEKMAHLKGSGTSFCLSFSPFKGTMPNVLWSLFAQIYVTTITKNRIL